MANGPRHQRPALERLHCVDLAAGGSQHALHRPRPENWRRNPESIFQALGVDRKHPGQRLRTIWQRAQVYFQASLGPLDNEGCHIWAPDQNRVRYSVVKMWTTITSLVAIVTASIVGLFFVYPHASNSTGQEDFKLEVAKVLLQLLVIAGVGTVFKVIYDQISANRTKVDAVSQLQRDFHERLVLRRTEVEKIRRSFAIQTAEVQLEKFRESIMSLLQERVELARLWHDIEASSDLFTDADRIQDMIDDMKVYLGQLTKEYENKKDEVIMVRSSDDFLAQNGLKRFEQFLKAGEEYTDLFLGSYRTALRIVRDNIVCKKRKTSSEFRFTAQQEPLQSTNGQPSARVWGTIPGGLYRPYVNAEPATVADGRFEAKVTLTDDDTRIRVTASDIKDDRYSERVAG